MSSPPDPLPESMKAWTFSHSGSPQSILQLSPDIHLPSLRTETSLLIRVSHVSIHPGTVIMMHFVPFLFRPSCTIAETDFSGTVVSTGKEVPVSPSSADPNRYFPPGTAVFGTVPIPKHLKGCGTLAEYVVVDMASVARKPANISFAEAAGLPVSGSTALTLLDAAQLKPDDKLLLNAPCGGIGHFVTQMLRAQRGRYIVGVCSEASAQLALRLGCDEVMDYHTTNEGVRLEETLSSNFSGENSFDAVIDAYGSQPLWRSALGFLKPGANHAYTTVGPALRPYTFRAMCSALKDMFFNRYLPKWMGGVGREYRQVTSIVDAGKLERLRELAEDGSLKTYIGGEWAFEDAVAAYEMLMSKHAKGKLVIRVSGLSSDSS